MSRPSTGTLVIAVASTLLIGTSACQKPADAPPAQNASVSQPDVRDRTVERRAVEAVIWGMPAVNYDLMRQASDSRSKGRGEPDRLLVPTAELEEPDAHPQP